MTQKDTPIKVLAQLDGYTFKTQSDGEDGFDSLFTLPIKVDAENINGAERGSFVNLFDGNAVEVTIESHSTGRPKVAFTTTLKGHTLATVKEEGDRYAQVYKFKLTFPSEVVKNHEAFIRMCSRKNADLSMARSQLDLGLDGDVE